MDLSLIINNDWFTIKPNQMNSGLFKNVILKICVYKSYIYIYIYIKDLALNNLQWLICHKNQTTEGFVTRWAITFSLSKLLFAMVYSGPRFGCLVFMAYQPL